VREIPLSELVGVAACLRAYYFREILDYGDKRYHGHLRETTNSELVGIVAFRGAHYFGTHVL